MNTIEKFKKQNENLEKSNMIGVFGCQEVKVESYGHSINNSGCDVHYKDTWIDRNNDGIRNCDEVLMETTTIECPPCDV